MEIMIKCKSLEHTYCPKCASKLRLSKDNRTGHCGHCGSVVTVDVPEQASIQNIEEEKAYKQISLFEA